jgi:putative phage-type endonuclease
MLSPERKGRLTASQFGAALGLNPYLSRQALWREMTGRAETFQGNEATDWGTKHETIAIDAYECETGSIVVPAPFIKFEDWCGATPDGYVGDDGLIEVKCPFSQRIYPEWPVYYMAQVIGQLGITGRSWCDCFCWTPDGYSIINRVYHEENTWFHMLNELREFYAHIEDDKEPTRKRKYKFLNEEIQEIATQP